MKPEGLSGRDTGGACMNSSIRSRLFLMMALEFAIWGCWLPLIYNYLPSLGFSTGQQSWILNSFPFAAISRSACDRLIPAAVEEVRTLPVERQNADHGGDLEGLSRAL